MTLLQDKADLDYSKVSLYWVLRLGNPWITRIAEKLDIVFPELENHFFILRAGDHGPLNNKADLNCS